MATYMITVSNIEDMALSLLKEEYNVEHGTNLNSEQYLNVRAHEILEETVRELNANEVAKVAQTFEVSDNVKKGQVRELLGID